MSYIYRGLGSSFERDETGIPQTKTDIELIGESILQILGTAKGERVMRPDFGANLYNIVFENNTEFIIPEVEHEVKEAIAAWEPRAKVSEVNVEIDETDLIITVEYSVMNVTGEVSKRISMVK